MKIGIIGDGRVRGDRMETKNQCSSCFHYKTCIHRHGKCRDFITWEMIEKEHDKFVKNQQR